LGAIVAVKVDVKVGLIVDVTADEVVDVMVDVSGDVVEGEKVGVRVARNPTGSRPWCFNTSKVHSKPIPMIVQAMTKVILVLEFFSLSSVLGCFL